MQLDNEEQRKFLLELIKQVSYPGHLLDLAYQTKQALSVASLAVPAEQNNEP